MMKLLVRGVNWLGDAIMTTPALTRLREAFPEAQISLLAPEKLAGLWRHHPSIDHCLSFSPRQGVWAVSRQLRSEGFDASLIFPNSIRSALESWLARIPRRVGHGGRGRGMLLTEVAAARPAEFKMRKRSVREIRALIRGGASERAAVFPAAAHHIYHYLGLAGAMGADPTPVAPSIRIRREEVMEALRLHSVPGDEPGRPLLGLNAGAEYGPAKRWPLERFIRAAVEAQRITGGRWVLFGGAGDRELTEKVEAGIRTGLGLGEAEGASVQGREGGPINLAGRTTLRELCAVLKACRVVLTNDTGPMHAAAAVGAPVVVPFGSTAPELTGPGLAGHGLNAVLRCKAACSPCFLRECPVDFRCMEGISVSEVVKALVEIVEERGGGSIDSR